MFCSRCGTEVPAATQYCSNCGLDLRGTTPVQGIPSGELTERDLVNEALSAEYEILEELGRGGMAIVFRARDRHLEREVALKVLPFSLAFDAEFVERFQREARTAAQLEHPNIIPIYRVGKSGRVIYFVMKLLRGPSLSKVLQDKKRLSVAEIRRLLIEAGNALGYAAKRGVVHRDIKPDNIMFDEFGQSVVADFGIAKAASGQKLTGTGMSIGTPHYMSPEQARAQPIDGRSDIYSLGIVAYQCLVGEVPYDGEDSFSIGYKHIMEPIPTPSLASPEERRTFEIIKRMIMKDPNDRFQDADELIRALEGQPLVAGQTRPGMDRMSLTTQPTTPIPSLQAEAIAAESMEAQARRPVGRRSAARQESERRSVGLWLVAFLLIAGGAGGVYAARRAGLIGAVADTTHNVGADTAVKAVRADSARDTTAAAKKDSLSGSAPVPTPVAVAPVPPPRHDTTPTPLPPASHDSGSLRVTGLPQGSNVMVDTKTMLETQIRLSTGSHELAIVAPGYEFYKDTIIIITNQELVVTPDLARIGAGIRPRERRGGVAIPCEIPNPANRFGRACYDDPPRPLGGTRVTLPAGFEGTPSASVYIVRVSVDGRTAKVISRVPSNDAAFEKLARTFVEQMQWTPAKKDGSGIDGWTQMVIQPDR
jgi:serine/threonine protein kinase